MIAEDEVLLNSLLDSLDRLYDEECGAFDVELLIVSTIIGLRDASWLPDLHEAQRNLRLALKAGGEDQDAVYSSALVATGSLRDRLAGWYTTDKITFVTHGIFAN